jgi:hypothetical protein
VKCPTLGESLSTRIYASRLMDTCKTVISAMTNSPRRNDMFPGRIFLIAFLVGVSEIALQANASMLVTRGQDKRISVVWEIAWK